MWQGDIAVDDAFGFTIASYGPRKLTVDQTVEAAENEADTQFWGVYRHNHEGEAAWFADAHDAESAKAIAEELSTTGAPATVAFIIAGAHEYMAEANPVGCREYMSLALAYELIAFAPALDRLVAGVTLTGDVSYAVVRPFGRWAMQELREHQRIGAGHAYTMAKSLMEAVVSS